jgi:ferredoxin
MPKITFLPQQISIEATENTKLLLVGIRNKIPMRYGCSAGQCGTCPVRVQGELSAMDEDERNLLHRLGLTLDASIRLACRARVLASDLQVDLSYDGI